MEGQEMTWQYQTRNVFIQFWPLWLSKLAWGGVLGHLGGDGPHCAAAARSNRRANGRAVDRWRPSGYLPRWAFVDEAGQVPVAVVAANLRFGYGLAGACTKSKELGQALLVVGVASGLLEVTLACMIACAQEITGQKMFSYGQALFPLAVVIAAPAVGLMRREGIDATAIFDVLAVFLVASAVAASLTSLQFPQIKVAGARPRA